MHVSCCLFVSPSHWQPLVALQLSGYVAFHWTIFQPHGDLTLYFWFSKSLWRKQLLSQALHIHHPHHSRFLSKFPVCYWMTQKIRHIPKEWVVESSGTLTSCTGSIMAIFGYAISLQTRITSGFRKATTVHQVLGNPSKRIFLKFLCLPSLPRSVNYYIVLSGNITYEVQRRYACG